jgi:HEAT repeat protein
MSKRPASAASGPIGSDELEVALLDPDPFVRVEALGKVVDDDGIVEAIGGALEDDYPLVRREAVRALSRIGGSHAARALVHASAHDLSAEVREEAVAALAEMLRVDGAMRSRA